MGKNKWSRHVEHANEDRNIDPGCMWGFIHALGYHSWRSRVKCKSLPRINDGNSHIRSIYSSKEKLVRQDSSELEMLLDDNESQLLVEKSTRKSKGSNKRSLKAKIKALIAEKLHKEKKRSKQKKSGSSNQPTEHDLNEKCSDKEHPIIFVTGNAEKATESLDKKLMNAIDAYDISTDKNALKSQLKDHAGLLLEILRESEAGYQNLFRGQLVSKKKARLTKSGSYPVSHLSRSKNFKPSKLEDKKNEVWSSAKGERLIGVTRTRSLSNYAKTLFTSLGLMDDNKELMDAEEGNKQSSTYELFENMNGEYESKSNGYCEIDGFEISKTTIMHRRSSSLNESMNRYTKLFEHSFRKEVNLNPSKSLKLTSEYEVPSSMPFRRIRSLSYSESCSLLPNGVTGDAQFSEWLIRTVEERNSHMRAESEKEENSIYTTEAVERSDNIKTVETITSLKPKTEESNAKVEELSDIIDEVMVFKGNSYEEQEIKFNGSTPNYVVPDSEICFEEDISNCAEFQISKGFAHKQNTDVHSLAKAYHHSKSYKKENADLFYVRDILEHSGFSSNFFKTTWYSQTLVLNPSIVQELESLWHQEQECCLGDFDFCCHHQLLFGLVNEVLVQMYDRSFTYYSRALSYSCRIRPLLENRVIEEVCNNVGTLLRLKPEQESIDAIVDRDLKMDDGWMNLQLESECLAIELEDMIFNDLLEELRGF